MQHITKCNPVMKGHLCEEVNKNLVTLPVCFPQDKVIKLRLPPEVCLQYAYAYVGIHVCVCVCVCVCVLMCVRVYI